MSGIAETLRRPVVLVAKLASAAAILVGSIAIAQLTEEYVRTSPAFAITEIEVEGAESLASEGVSEEALITAAGLAVGQNAFEVPPEDAQARLERHPWIASAHVSRRLPGTYSITVRTRRPVALLALEALYLVGEDGTLFKQVALDDPADLPVVTGVDRARFARDRAYRTSLLLDVVALMHDYRGAGLWRREPIGEIHFDADDSVGVYVGDDATHVRLGQAPFRGKLRKLRRILDRLREQESRAHYVYLDNERRPDRVTVRLRE